MDSSRILSFSTSGIMEECFRVEKGMPTNPVCNVPLVVRIPENFKNLADHERGTRTDGFVSFIDFGPTVLNLAGLSVPEEMDGSAFLGKGTTAKKLASGTRRSVTPTASTRSTTW